MVLRFLMLLTLFVFSCADHERDNVYDSERKNSQYKLCGNEEKYDTKEQRCNTINKKDSIIESKCGSSWYNPKEQRCDKNIIESKCGSDWYNPKEQKCNTINKKDSIIESKCGSDWYNTKEQRCNNNITIENKCGSGWYDASNSNLHCQSNVLVTRCGSDWYDASNSNLRCRSNVVETMCGSDWYDASKPNLRCQSNVLVTRCGNDEWYNAATALCSYGEVLKYGILRDSRDQKTYKTIAIEDVQTWMVENLNYAANNSDCHNNDPANCTKYGRIYDWNTARNNACPQAQGWRLPEDNDWEYLASYIDADDYGSALMPSGLNDDNWWSATPGDEAGYAYVQMYPGKEGYLFDSKTFKTTRQFSVRCVRDD
jgi:uncharacterized low-complexity protein